MDEKLAPRAQGKGIELLWGRESGRLPAWIVADGLRLSQVFLNLAGNAVKFTGIMARSWCTSRSPRLRRRPAASPASA